MTDTIRVNFPNLFSFYLYYFELEDMFGYFVVLYLQVTSYHKEFEVVLYCLVCSFIYLTNTSIK